MREAFFFGGSMPNVIGVAGCGRMGLGMLKNLQNAGFDARGFDVRPVPGVERDLPTFCKDLSCLLGS